VTVYLPGLFAETRIPVLHEFVERYSFATLIVSTSDGPTANHVPLVLDPARGTHGTLVGHIARANPLWRQAPAQAPALAVFHGPHRYVSPTWYASRAATGEVVPTWNYEVVHARGTITFFEDRAQLRALVERLTESQERGRPNAWQVAEAPAGYLATMLDAIVGLEIALTGLVGKFKASQNRNPADRAGVVAGLTAEGVSAGEIAELVRAPGTAK
jgi:transcriptional regulator